MIDRAVNHAGGRIDAESLGQAGRTEGQRQAERVVERVGDRQVQSLAVIDGLACDRRGRGRNIVDHPGEGLGGGRTLVVGGGDHHR